MQFALVDFGGRVSASTKCDVHEKRRKKMKRILTCLAATLMVCSVASGAAYTWNNGAGDRDFMNTGNWGPVPPAIAAGDDMWVHENGVLGSMATISPHVTTDTGVSLHWVVLGYGGGLGGGVVDIDAGGTLRVDHVVMGWDAAATAHTGVLSLNAGGTLINGILQVGNGGLNTHVINDGGTIGGGKLWVGNFSTGSAQVDLLAGDTWLASADADALVIDTGENVDLENGRMLLIGDRTALINGLLDGRLTGYGSSANIQVDYDVTQPGWTTVTAIPEPATFSLVAMLGGGLLWIRKRLTI